MRMVNPLLHLCVFAASVSAFFPFTPDYVCDADEGCGSSSKREVDGTVAQGLGIGKSLEVRTGQVKRRDFRIVPSIEPSLPNSAAVNQDGSDFSYMAKVRFGSQKTELNMLLDSGSSRTWVYGHKCTSPACLTHQTFDNTTSTTFVYKDGHGMYQEYGDEVSVGGDWGSDTIEFAGFSFPLAFLVIDQASDDFKSYAFDGILGLAHNPDDKFPDFTGELMKRGLIESDLFSINLHRNADETNDGAITFGAVDTSKYTGDITYLSTQAPHTAWNITVGDSGFNGKGAGLAGRYALIDTGTTYIFIPRPDADAFYATLPDARKTVGSNVSYTVRCDTKIPAQFKFGDKMFEVSYKDWVGGKSRDGEDRCTSNIYAGVASKDPATWVFGDTFLKNVYTIFDFEGKRVGFAEKAEASVVSSTVAATATRSSHGVLASFTSSRVQFPGRFPSTTSTCKNSPSNHAGGQSTVFPTTESSSDSTSSEADGSTSSTSVITTTTIDATTESNLGTSTDSEATATSTSESDTESTDFAHADTDPESSDSASETTDEASTNPATGAASSSATTSHALIAASFLTSIAFIL